MEVATNGDESQVNALSGMLHCLHADLENLLVEHKWVTKKVLTDLLAEYFPDPEPQPSFEPPTFEPGSLEVSEA